MSHEEVDLDALFDEVSSQRHEEVDLEALFDEVSSQRPAITDSVSVAPALTPAMQVAASEATDVVINEPVADVGAAGAGSDVPMFARLGGIVRLLHDSLRELGYDRSLSDVASEITDAKGRLEHVATLTEQAANKVLNTIDEGMPALDSLSKAAKDIEARWARLFAGEMSVDEFKLLAADSRRFSSDALATSEAEKARLLDIMMAQDFQDLTGQLIKKIVGITHKAEQELAQLLKDNAPAEYRASQAPEVASKPVDLMQGPAAVGVALEQDDVDNLLDTLGF